MRSEARKLAFEATPDYLFYPPTPERVAERLPDARFVVLLRDPVERAYSHYRHMVRLGFEDRPFEQALARETERIARADVSALDRDPLFFCQDLLALLLRDPGPVRGSAARWFAVFDRSGFLILRSEDLFADPGGPWTT